MEQITIFVIDFLNSNPNLAIVITIMSVARAVFKPACSLIQAYVDSTPKKSDNEKWAKIQSHKAFKAVAYAMDFLFSIKLPQKDEEKK